MPNDVIHKNNVSHGRRYYKQMSLEVAVRNPERYAQLISIFNQFDGIRLNDEGILEIFAQLYIEGFLTAENVNVAEMSKSQIKTYIKENNSHNNEWGFPTGYQAAFTRYLKTLSEFGFIYAQYNQTFKISPIGQAFALGFIQPSEAFAVQSMRFWRKSPYRRVLNDFNYFEFILKILIRLKSMNKRLSYVQFMVSLFSDDGDVDDFINIITTENFGSDMEKAYEYVCNRYSLIDSEHAKAAKLESAFRDYGNTVFRVLQLTGFITVEYSGIMLLSINTNRIDFLKELMSLGFSLEENEKDNEYDYFVKIGSYPEILKKIINKYREKPDYSTAEYNKKMPQILSSYGLNKESLAEYLKDVSEDKSDRKQFWFIQAPIKFEFLLTLFLYSCYGDEFEYRPNFKCDDAGIPYAHAPGNVGDIEIFNETFYWLLEATLIKNKTQQLNNETVNLIRHVNDKFNGEKFLELIAPFIHDDTQLMLRTASLVSMIEKKGSRLYSKATSTSDFVKISFEKRNIESIKEYSISTFREIKTLLDDYMHNYELAAETEPANR